MRRHLSVGIKILLFIGLVAVLIISKMDHGIGMAGLLTFLKVTHLDLVVVLFGAIYIFATHILPHIWPVVLIVAVGSALIVMARRRAGRDSLTQRPTLLDKED
jgi:hypothetical protein